MALLHLAMLGTAKLTVDGIHMIVNCNSRRPQKFS